MMNWWEGNISNWESAAERHIRGSDFTELEEGHLNNSVLNLILIHKHKLKIILQILENMNRETASIHWTNFKVVQIQKIHKYTALQS